jgi:hypothetical protein
MDCPHQGERHHGGLSGIRPALLLDIVAGRHVRTACERIDQPSDGLTHAAVRIATGVGSANQCIVCCSGEKAAKGPEQIRGTPRSTAVDSIAAILAFLSVDDHTPLLA